MMRKVRKESCPVGDAYGKKNMLPPAPDFLVGFRITATSAGKSVHTFPVPPPSARGHSRALILIASGFYNTLSMQSNDVRFLTLKEVRNLLIIFAKGAEVDRPLFINPGIETKP